MVFDDEMVTNERIVGKLVYGGNFSGDGNDVWSDGGGWVLRDVGLGLGGFMGWFGLWMALMVWHCGRRSFRFRFWYVALDIAW